MKILTFVMFGAGASVQKEYSFQFYLMTKLRLIDKGSNNTFWLSNLWAWNDINVWTEWTSFPYMRFVHSKDNIQFLIACNVKDVCINITLFCSGSNYNSWNPCTSIFNIIRIGFPLKGHCCKLMLSELQFWDEFIYIRTDPGHKKYA